MTAPDHATSHSKNTLRERGHPYMGFLGAPPFRCERPARTCWILLDFLGEFLVRIETFQWVTRLLATRIFLAPFRAVLGTGTGVCGRGHAEALDRS